MTEVAQKFPLKQGTQQTDFGLSRETVEMAIVKEGINFGYHPLESPLTYLARSFYRSAFTTQGSFAIEILISFVA